MSIRDHPIFPLRPPRRSRPYGPLETWFRRHPALRAAYLSARDRFEKLPGVCGIGVGRKFRESRGRYAPPSAANGGLCIKVFVEGKRDDLPRSQRIPRWMVVAVPGEKKRRRVPLDVVTVGEIRQEQGRGWPTAGVISPGRLFAFGLSPADSTGSSLTAKDVELGTTGALVRLTDGSMYATSAGHVFTNPCRDELDAPKEVRAIGALDRTWLRVDGSWFYPLTLRHGDRMRDVMMFPVPPEYRPAEPTWPDGFLKELATQEDIDRAVLAEDSTAFVWVERKERLRPQAIPVDVEAAKPFFTGPVTCGNSTKMISYTLTWPLRFIEPDHETCGGDSGSAVFVWTKNNAECRLLGFHFARGPGRSYAMDAESFFRDALGAKPGEDFTFP